MERLGIGLKTVELDLEVWFRNEPSIRNTEKHNSSIFQISFPGDADILIKTFSANS